MLVFLKTYEEANCTMAGDCKYSFTDVLPEITGVSSMWDINTLQWNLKVVGTGISGTIAETEFMIGAAKQETLSISSQETVVKVIDAASEVLDGSMLIYWKVGLGKGYDKLTGITLIPKLVSVNPKKGSAGGTLITLNVQGVGKSTTGL
jgi:hypothetical protein